MGVAWRSGRFEQRRTLGGWKRRCRLRALRLRRPPPIHTCRMCGVEVDLCWRCGARLHRETGCCRGGCGAVAAPCGVSALG